MLQIGVALYCLALWAGIVFGSYLPDSLTGVLALAILTAILLIPLAPRVLGLVLTSLDLAPPGPRARPQVPAVRIIAVLGAPGTPGAAAARAPNVA